MEYPKSELFEKLADIEHQRWSDWQKYMHSLCERIPTENGDALIISAESVKQWERQIETDYINLTDKEKDSDRDQVMRYWKLIDNTHKE